MSETSDLRGNNIIDSRDVIERIAHLQKLKNLDDEEKQELQDLLDLQNDASWCSEWEDGATLVADKYFVEHAKELAEDVGAINPQSWVYYFVDWDGAARDLRMDYSNVEFGEETYWLR